MNNINIRDIHYISSGNLIEEQYHSHLISDIADKQNCKFTHSHYPNHSNHDLFNELLELSLDIEKNDLVIVLWNNPRIINYVKFNNDKASIKTSHTIQKVDYMDYFDFIKQKENFWIHESIILFHQINRFIHLLQQTNYFMEMFPNNIPLIPHSNPIEFDGYVGLYEYLDSKNILVQERNEVDGLLFQEIIGNHINQEIDKLKPLI